MMGTFYKRPTLWMILFLGLVTVFSWTAWAAEIIIEAPQAQRVVSEDDTLYFAGRFSTEPFVLLADAQLNQLRGGLGGFHFGIDFSGVFDKFGNLSGRIFSDGDLLTNQDGSAVTIPSDSVLSDSPVNIPSDSVFSDSPDELQNLTPPAVGSVDHADLNGAAISAYVGDFDGASGIFQISQSPGSYNVIHNNMNIYITIYNLQDESQLPALLPSFQLPQ